MCANIIFRKKEYPMTDLEIIINCKNPDCIHFTKPIEFNKSNLLEECPICHSSLAFRYSAIQKKHWLTELYEDETYWLDNVENAYPAILAYEYNCLRSLCKDGQPYGVLLSLKDNFESLLKLEVLLACAWACTNTEESVIHNAVAQLMKPNPSLGLWHDTASVIQKELRRAGYVLPEVIPLETIRKQYIKHEIIKWRNTKIGHGAMELSEDESFIEDIKKKTKCLRDIYAKIDVFLKNQEFYIADDNASEHDLENNIYSLTGFRRARLLEKEGSVYFRDRTSKNSFCIDPFIVIRKHEKNGNGVYFFDNQRTSSDTYFLAYADGNRKKETIPYFKKLQKLLETGVLNMQAQADDIFLSEEEIRQLDIPHMSHDYITPTHIVGWLKDCLKTHKKGIFILQMPRGTGKSVFTEKINRLFRNPEIIIEGVDIRTYHFSRSQSVGSDDFRHSIEWQWKNEFGKHSWERGGSIADYYNKDLTPSHALCKFLEEIRQYSERTRGCDRILMVLDGIDEITDDTLWSFIPEESILTPGIYFLLTSRNPSEEDISEEVTQRIESIQSTERYVVNCTSEGHSLFLKDYYQKTQLKKYPEDLFNQIALLSDGRTLFFGMLCKLVENGMNPEDLPKTERMVEVYLDTLKKKYGEKESIRLREILTLLCVFGSIEPLSLQTLSAIMGENGITLQLIGIIRDLSPMLKIERSDSGNLYSVVNADLADQIAHEIPETEEFIRWLIQLAMSIMSEQSAESEKFEPVFCNMVEIANKWVPEKIDILGDGADRIFSEYLNNKAKASCTYQDRLFLLKFARQLFFYRRQCFGEADVRTINIEKAVVKYSVDLGYYQEALTYNKDLSDITQKRGILDFEVVHGKLTALMGLEKYEEAEALSKMVYEVYRKTLGETNPLVSSAKAYPVSIKMMQGSDINQADLAIMLDDYKKAKAAYGNENEKTLWSANNFAFALANMKRYDEAEKIYTQILSISKRVLGENHISTIAFQSNLANLYSLMGLINKSIRLNLEVYSKQKATKGKAHKDTALTELELFKSYALLGEYDKAEKYCKKSLYHTCIVFGDNSPEVRNLENFIISYVKDFREWDNKQILSMIQENRSKRSGMSNTSNKAQKSIEKKMTFEMYAKACEKEYETNKKELGDADLKTLASKEKLAECCFQMAKYKESLKSLKEILEAYSIIAGEDTREAIDVEYHIALNYFYLRRYFKALRVYENVERKSEKVNGKYHPATLSAKHGIGLTLYKMGRLKESCDILTDVCQGRMESLGELHYKTLESQNDLADILIALGDYHKALQTYQDVYEKRKKVLGGGDFDTVITLRGILVSYNSIGNKEEVNRLLPTYEKLRKAALQANTGLPKHQDNYLKAGLIDFPKYTNQDL